MKPATTHEKIGDPTPNPTSNGEKFALGLSGVWQRIGVESETVRHVEVTDIGPLHFSVVKQAR